jgi:hypothetical protein
MVNGSAGLVRRIWDTLLAWERVMDYRPYDYAVERIAGLEREVTHLREELKRARTLAGAADDGLEQSRARIQSKPVDRSGDQ